MGPAGNILTTRKLIAVKFVTLQYFLIGTKKFACIFGHYIRYTCSNARKYKYTVNGSNYIYTFRHGQENC